MSFIKENQLVIVLVIILTCYMNILAQSPCILQNNIITRQSQLDSIPLLHPGCNYLENINISGKEIFNVKKLSQFTKFDHIVIDKTNIKNLNGLESLVWVGNLHITSNDSLLNIISLSDIKYIDFISVLNNNMLSSFEGIKSDTINHFIIGGNSKCKSFERVKSKYIAKLWFHLQKLDSLSGHEVEKVDTIDLLKPDNILGLNSFDPIKIDIVGFSPINDISEINPLNRLSELILAYNKNLSMCSIDKICRNLDNPGFILKIISNAPGCNSKEEIRQKCISSTNQNETENELSLFPNPVHESLQISGLDGDVSFSIYNQVGALVQKGSTSGNVDVLGLPQGMYMLNLTGTKSGYKTVFRFVKM